MMNFKDRKDKISFKELRDKIDAVKIVEILSKYDFYPVYECSQYLVFPTICHNVHGGSHKLYYYFNSKMFKCYTECGVFDIFDLIIKLEDLRGNRIGKKRAIEITGLRIEEGVLPALANESIAYEAGKLYAINSVIAMKEEDIPLTVLDKKFLDDRFIFSKEGTQSWVDEGISYMTMLAYGIRYDPINECIIIPHWDDVGNLVGVRGRYLSPEAKGKYKPILYNGKALKHSLNKTLYGLFQNKDAIKQNKSVIIFEGEKSVLKMHSFYDNNNISVATCGKNISQTHIKLLFKAGVKNVILAYDADYQNYQEANARKEEYIKIARPLITYFNTSIIIDYNKRLSYKDSPIDKGINIFLELQKERIHI